MSKSTGKAPHAGHLPPNPPDVAALICPKCKNLTSERTSTSNGYCRSCDLIFANNADVTFTQAEALALKAEAARNVVRYTARGYAAGENADAKHWRERAEKAEALLYLHEQAAETHRAKVPTDSWRQIETAPKGLQRRHRRARECDSQQGGGSG